MTLLQAVLMGLLQGLTEFLPVSSSGHLAIFKNIFHINTETGMLFDILLHIGTLIAIFVAYYKDIWKMIVEGFGILIDLISNAGIFFGNLFSKNDAKMYRKVMKNAYRKFVMLIIVSTIPTGILGVLGKDLIEEAGAGLIVPGICLIITACLLMIADYCGSGKKTPKDTRYLDAFSVGVAQGVATLPGLSRSGTTITACLLCGFDKKFAVKYSFIMSIPAILGAAVLEMKDIGELTLKNNEVIHYAAGMAVAAIVGYICIKTMLVVVRGKKFKIFSIYCFAAGALAICGHFFLS
ncbi:undecaprenyl-diphosphate phosphatase [bacterium C-53]|nr:undecaprenyl-diphosphate phosphatase [Lachnospiraceae bacterium]NBI03502.1 undecaprenyl-diphosphate phosphatase [Lachnospiraceae bacterium]RKJ09502.1 undecaprenyl-diphosphate phosphatase [bacterium C-53]